MAKPKNNPYQLLIVAALFFLPAVFLLIHEGPAAVAHYGNRQGKSVGIEIQPEGVVHVHGYALLLMSAALAGLYFY